MKQIAALLLGLWVLPVVAQSYGGMSEGQMQQMMSKMTEMQACYETVDQSRLEQMMKDAETMEAELKQMCANGGRAKAQVMAINYGMKYSKDPAIKQLRDCAEIAQGMMPPGMMPEIPDYTNLETYENQHVCDQL